MIRSRHSTGDLLAQFHASSIMDDGGIARRVNPLARGAVCAVPGCIRPPAGRKSPLCATCKSRVVSRARRWYAARPDAGKPPLAYLFAKKHAGIKRMGR